MHILNSPPCVWWEGWGIRGTKKKRCMGDLRKPFELYAYIRGLRRRKKEKVEIGTD